MTELTPTAENRLNGYLNELRRVLSESPSVDPAEVERDVRDHIEAALVGQAAPVEDSALDKVLQTLGAPSQWLSESAQPVRRPLISVPAIKQIAFEFVRRLVGGPESYRLSYLSLLVFAVGWTLALLAHDAGPLLVAMPVSFILSRAALSLFTAERLSVGQKWLLYPVLAVADCALLVLILIAPIVIAVDVWERPYFRARPAGAWGGLGATICGWAGATWLCVGILCTLFPAVVRNVFHPFARQFSRRSGLKLATVGLVLLLIAGATGFFGRLAEGPSARVEPLSSALLPHTRATSRSGRRICEPCGFSIGLVSRCRKVTRPSPAYAWASQRPWQGKVY
jgi:hypothetical protein